MASSAQTQAASNAQINADVIGTILTSPRVRLYCKRIYSNLSVSPGSVLQIQPDKTGFLSGFWVKVKYTVSNPSKTAAVSSLPMAPYKIIQELTYTGYSSANRHKTTGLELALIMQQRLGGEFGAFADPVVELASVGAITNNPDSIAESGSENGEIWFYIPIIDPASNQLNGIEFGQYEKAQASINLTMASNTTASNTDPFFGMYDGAVTLSDISVEVYQNYYNGRLLSKNGIIVKPQISIDNMYSILSSKVPETYSPSQVSRDVLDQNYIYRGYGLLYDNGGVFNPASGVDRDIETIGLYVETDTPIHQYDPALLKAYNMAAVKLGNVQDGFYFFNFGSRPINASKNGQYNIGLTPLTVETGAYVRRTLEVYRAASIS